MKTHDWYNITLLSYANMEQFPLGLEKKTMDQPQFYVFTTYVHITYVGSRYDRTQRLCNLRDESVVVSHALDLSIFSRGPFLRSILKLKKTSL